MVACPSATALTSHRLGHDGKAIRVRSYYDTHGYAAALLGT
jgi:hypothetical protein